MDNLGVEGVKTKKAFLILSVTTMTFLASFASIALDNASLKVGTESIQQQNGNLPQIANGDYASLNTLHEGTIWSSPNTQGTGTRGPNIFSIDSFVRDLSSGKVDGWSDFAYFDENSAEFVIGVNPSHSDSYAKVNELILQKGGRLADTVSIEGQIVALVADIPIYSMSTFVSQLQASGAARYVEPNMKYQTQLVPNDPYWNRQWGPQKIEADFAWNTTTGSANVLVAVIDTGVDYLHEDISQNYVPLGYDWVNKDDFPMDDHGHGTHVAGIIAAVLNNGKGIAGVAQVKIMAEKGLNFAGGGTEQDLANAIIHAANTGADILSNSWGGPDSQLIHDAIKYAYSKGSLIVAAAGNAASQIKLYPAAYDEVMAVTATDQFDMPAVFTSFGDWVEVAAPGVDIYSSISSVHDPRFQYPYDYLSGTSMATPHVSATAALIWGQFPDMTRDWVSLQLKFTSDDLGDPGFDKYYGYGRVNARKAVEQGPAEHDLLIYEWQRPKFVQPGDHVAFNVTVFNFGLDDESKIMVQLFVDSDLTDTEFIELLATGHSDTVKLPWDTTLEGPHNVTVYIEPVPGEIVTRNNVLSVNVDVHFIEVALFKNVDPWGSVSNEEILEKQGVPYAMFGSKDFGVVNLTAFSKIVISSDQDQGFYNDMGRYRWWFEDYVNKGGMLEIHAADIGWNGGAWVGSLPGGLQLYHFVSDLISIVDRSHPVVTMPNKISDSELDNWDASVHGYFSFYPAVSRIVMREDYTGYPVYLEFKYGAGVIVASAQTLEWAYDRDLSSILENSLLYFAVKYPHELAVAVETPRYQEPGHSLLLNATVFNIGLNNETNVELQLLIDGTIVKSHAVDLPSGWSFTINYLWSPSEEATYNITAYCPPVPDEHLLFNNRISQLVQVVYPLIRPVPGQWANYTMSYYDENDQLTGVGYWNLTYDYYVKPYLMHVTARIKDPSGPVYTGWMIVNIMNRWVVSGFWAGLWYPAWIETDINVGSTINLLYGKATVNASRMVPVDIYPIDCWEIPVASYGYVYDFFYDKASGLWIGMDYMLLIRAQLRGELRLVDTNVSIGTKFEHELAVTLKAPAFLEPGDTSLLNATAYNIGLNTEENVKLSLFVDGEEVRSMIIAKFDHGTSFVLSYLWQPTAEAKYNVTAYVQPVLGEAFSSNNAATKMVQVRTIKGYVLFDQTHGTDSVSLYRIWIGNLTDRGYVVDTLSSSPISLPMLKPYDVFVIPQARNYYWQSEIEAIQDFVTNGGGLLVVGDDLPMVYSDLTRFAGINWEWGGVGGPTSDITPHPVTKGVVTVYFGAPSNRLFVNASAQGLVRDVNGNLMLAASEVKNGAVIAIADEDSLNDGNIVVKYTDNIRLANNVIDWLKSRSPIVSFTCSPSDPFVGETVTFDASASYDPDGTIISYLWDFGDGSTGSGVKASHVYSEGGAYTITFTAIDNDALNSTATEMVTVQRTTMNVEVRVGSIHFRGEMAEFYVLVSSLGKPVDADVNATLYFNGKPYASLSNAVQQIGTGLYRIPYTIPIDAQTGTYALVVEAAYLTLNGTSLETFLLSSTLTGWNAMLVSINGTMGVIRTDLGMITVDLNKINTTLAGLDNTVATVQTDIGTIKTDISTIQLKVTAIDGDTATIETTLGTVSGKITQIEGDIATIQTSMGTVKADIGSVKEGQQGLATPLYIIPVVVVAIGAIIMVLFMRRKP